MMDTTIAYYENNAESFAKGTVDIEFSNMQDIFLSELKEGASILDFGCGSGRDTKYFMQKGYRVSALDGSAGLCRIAEENAPDLSREEFGNRLSEIVLPVYQSARSAGFKEWEYEA